MNLLNEVSPKYDHVVRYSRLISVKLPPQEQLCLHTHNLTMHMHVCTSLVHFSTQTNSITNLLLPIHIP